MFRQITRAVTTTAVRQNSAMIQASATLHITPAGQPSSASQEKLTQTRSETKIFTDADWDSFLAKNKTQMKVARSGPSVACQGGDRTSAYEVKDLTNRVYAN